MALINFNLQALCRKQGFSLFKFEIIVYIFEKIHLVTLASLDGLDQWHYL